MYYACMIMVCHRTKFDVPNYNGLLVISTKPKVEEKYFAVLPCYFTCDKGISNDGFEKQTSQAVSLYQADGLIVSFSTNKFSNR
jgi:hypothetical protein